MTYLAVKLTRGGLLMVEVDSQGNRILNRPGDEPLGGAEGSS